MHVSRARGRVQPPARVRPARAARRSCSLSSLPPWTSWRPPSTARRSWRPPQWRCRARSGTSCATSRSYARALRPRSARRTDPSDRLSLLAARLPYSGFARDGEVYIDGFTDFTAQEKRVICELMDPRGRDALPHAGQRGLRKRALRPRARHGAVFPAPCPRGGHSLARRGPWRRPSARPWTRLRRTCWPIRRAASTRRGGYASSPRGI